MTKFHLNNNNEVKPCHAKKRSCRYEQHFENEEAVAKHFSTIRLPVVMKRSTKATNGSTALQRESHKVPSKRAQAKREKRFDEITAIDVANRLLKEREKLTELLTDDERHVLRSWSFVGNEAINETLLNGTTPNKKVSERIRLLDNVFRKHETLVHDNPPALYRAVKFKDSEKYEKFVNSIVESGGFHSPAYMSSSLDSSFMSATVKRDKIFKRGKNHNVVLKFLDTNGVPVHNEYGKKGSIQSWEMEKLIDRDRSFKLVSDEVHSYSIHSSRVEFANELSSLSYRYAPKSFYSALKLRTLTLVPENS